MRLRNSGCRNARSSSCSTSRSASSPSGVSKSFGSVSSRRLLPMLLVMMTTVFEKSAVRPRPSVRRPSSSTWRSRLKTSACAFSTSSKRSTLYGSPAHGLGEKAALLAVDVPRRRADQALRHVLLHELAHVEAGHRLLVVEQELGERLGELGLADAARAQEEERSRWACPDRAGRRARAARRATRRARPRPARRRARRGAPPSSSSLSLSASSILLIGMPVHSPRTRPRPPRSRRS